MPNRTRIVLSLALLLAAALLALPAPPAQSQGPSATPTPAPSSEPRILYSAGIDGRIVYFTMNADGSEKNPVRAAFFASGRWILGIGSDLEGDRLAFGAVDLETADLHQAFDNDSDIYLLDLTTNEVRQLTTQEYGNYSPVWSPDGSEIAYNEGAGNGLLRIIDVETLEIRPMLDGSILLALVSTSGRVTGFDWSPDGSQLAASANLLGPEGYHALVLMDVNGTGLRELLSADVNGEMPTWGSQNHVLYYTCWDNPDRATAEICTMNLNTSETHQLTHLTDSLGLHSFDSLDASNEDQIVFALEHFDTDTWDIYRYDLVTGELINLTADIDVGVYAPRWIESPPAGR